MLGNSLQGIGEHYIAIPLEQVDVSCYVKDGTVRCLLRRQPEAHGGTAALIPTAPGATGRSLANPGWTQLLRLFE